MSDLQNISHGMRVVVDAVKNAEGFLGTPIIQKKLGNDGFFAEVVDSLTIARSHTGDLLRQEERVREVIASADQKFADLTHRAHEAEVQLQNALYFLNLYVNSKQYEGRPSSTEVRDASKALLDKLYNPHSPG